MQIEIDIYVTITIITVKTLIKYVYPTIVDMIPLIRFDSDVTLIKIFHVRVKSVPETVRPGSGCDNYWKLYLLTPKFSNTLRWLLTLSVSFLPKPVTSSAKGNLRRSAYDRCLSLPLPYYMSAWWPAEWSSHPSSPVFLPPAISWFHKQLIAHPKLTGRLLSRSVSRISFCVYLFSFLSKCGSHPTKRKELFPVWKPRVLT